ncbi:heterogeneous nuclear ribonucleoprotein L, partial [Geospiza fortis]|uniref:Heterogeneous nuclear ribonucleoprotein L n=1 Tax=Geospiza fortis TaxID=48883 RepID=A0A8N5I5G9_GEOFO
MPKKRQALVEFEDILGACNAVNYAADNQIYFAGHPAFVNYSTSQKISRPGDSDDARGVNNVLLFTILNPIYSITTDVLYTICNPCGPVQRIVIFRKNGVQAMVEFDSVQSAQRAKASLNGADIYSGCCTLKIEYAKPSRLNVFKNDQDTWDYTNPNLSGTGPPQEHSRTFQRHLQDHPGSTSGTFQNIPGPPSGPPREHLRNIPEHSRDTFRTTPGAPQEHSRTFQDRPRCPGCLGVPRRGRAPFRGRFGAVSGPLPLSPVPVPHLSLSLTCPRSPAQVKFMKSKPGAAMVEMADGYAVDRAITHLNNNFMFGQKLNVCVSKQHAIMPGQSYGLPQEDAARRAWALRRRILELQESFSAMEK